MFEDSSKRPTPEQIAALDELFERRCPSETPESAALVDRICDASRAENRAAAARLVAIGELFALRLSRCSETETWAVDTMEAVGAEVSAALRISRELAGSYLRYARAMRERLPNLAEVFKAGDISFRLFQTVVYRTDLITDPGVLATVDAELAVRVPRWPSMTQGRLAGAVDKTVARVDRDAVRRRRDQQARRRIEVWHCEGGMSEIAGILSTADAMAFDQRLDALAVTVCTDDPRTRQERRADAAGALASGADRLSCRCGRSDCVAGDRPPAGAVVVHVIAEQATVDGGETASASLVESDGFLPAESVAELLNSAKRVAVVHPGDAPPEPGYTPSRALADFVRCRDMTCRFPGCDVPATRCDLDHTVPYRDGGPTHASNIKCYCRTHHLLKTFWGWRDKQLTDGTVILVAPNGHTYVTTPGSALLFPRLCLPTGELDIPATPVKERRGDRTAMMPTRHRTRAQNRAHRIATERRQNQRAREARRQQAVIGYSLPDTYDDDPPPF